MSEPVDERAARLDQALADSQRQERSELDLDIARQLRADEGIVEALAKDDASG